MRGNVSNERLIGEGESNVKLICNGKNQMISDLDKLWNRGESIK